MSSSSDAGRGPGTRIRILKAALEVIDERGSELTLADVADRAGVSRQSVYLHFGDRSGLLTALVEYGDETLGLEDLVENAFAAPTGADVLSGMMRLHAEFTPKIDAICRILEPGQYVDEALRAAWRNRMVARLAIYRSIVQRIADEDRLAPGWSVDHAAAMCYVITMPGPWRELTIELGWSPDLYAELLARFIQSGILAR